MRILLVVHGFPPTACGGSELYAEAHARLLASTAADQVMVLTREHAPERQEHSVRRETRDGFTIVRINNTFAQVRCFAETYANEGIDLIARRAIDEFRPDLAHIHHLTCLTTTIVDALAERRVPAVLTLHDYWLMCHRGQLLDVDYANCDGPGRDGCGKCVGPEGGAGPTAFAGAAMLRTMGRRLPGIADGLRRAAERAAAWRAPRQVVNAAEQARAAHMRALCEKVTLFLAPSAAMRARFIGFGISPERIKLAEYGIDLTPFRELARVPSGRLRFGFLGSLMISKGPHLLLEAFRQLPAGSASLDLFGAFSPYHGDASYWQSLEPMLAQPDVRAHGAWPHHRVAEALSGIDVLVVPSIWPENAAFVIREAFAAGLPVVASRIGGTPEYVLDGVNGLLFEPGSADDLRRALQRLVAEPDLLQNLRRGIPRVHSIVDDVKATKALYASLVR